MPSGSHDKVHHARGIVDDSDAGHDAVLCADAVVEPCAQYEGQSLAQPLADVQIGLVNEIRVIMFWNA